MQETNNHIRNSRGMIVLMYSLSVIFWLLTAGFALLLVGLIMTFKDSSISSMVGVLIATLSIGRFAIWSKVVAGKMSKNEIRLDPDAVHIVLSDGGKGITDTAIPWDQLNGVTKVNSIYTVSAADGRNIDLTGYDFFGIGKIAQQIALRAGKKVEAHSLL